MSIDYYYWLDTGWGCGGIIIRNGKVERSAPIFRKLIGQTVERLRKRYKVISLQPEGNGMNFDYMLVDGNYVARKMFAVNKMLHAIVDGREVQTGLTHGFLLQLIYLKEEYKGRIIVVWDRGHDRRRAIDPSYKEERRERGDDWEEREAFEEHRKVLYVFLRLLGVTQAFKRGEEGDDILYTLARRFEGKRLMVTNDHDLYQALGEGVYQLLAKRDGYVLYSARRLEREQGVTPEQFTWAMSLAGCSGDGIKGVPGVGMKTAIGLVKQYPGLVPAVLAEHYCFIYDTDCDRENPAQYNPQVDSRNKVKVATDYFDVGDKGPGKRVATIVENPETVYLTNQLISLYDVWPVTFKKPTPDFDALMLQLERCELHELTGRIDILKRLHK